MYEKDGVGLAAPQVGVLLRLFVVTADDGVRRVFINPRITAMSETIVTKEEGCLSIPGIFGDVPRPEAVTVQAQDARGRRFTLEADGMLARVIQHENDHLEGVLYLDRTSPQFRAEAEARFRLREERRRQKQAQKQAKAARRAARAAAEGAGAGRVSS